MFHRWQGATKMEAAELRRGWVLEHQKQTNKTRQNQQGAIKQTKKKQNKTRQDKFNKELPGWRLQNCGEGEY